MKAIVPITLAAAAAAALAQPATLGSCGRHTYPKFTSPFVDMAIFGDSFSMLVIYTMYQTELSLGRPATMGGIQTGKFGKNT